MDDNNNNDSTNNDVTTSARSEEDDDLQRWEKMYYQNKNMLSMNDDDNAVDDTSFAPVRVITFDLDNTLWKTSPTIADANTILNQYMQEKVQSLLPSSNNNTYKIERVEHYMKLLFQENPSKYCPNYIPEQRNNNIKPAPVLLTLLRKDAIEYAFRHAKNVSSDSSNNNDTEIYDENEIFIQEAFDIWMNARKESIQNNLADSVMETLEHIRQVSDDRIIIGAITDGNSNPLQIEFLKMYFDFCVNAEMIGISKPNKQLYIHAAKQHVFPLLLNQNSNNNTAIPTFLPSADWNQLERMMSSTSNDFNSNGTNQIENNNDAENSIDYDNFIESLIGPWWVHIGDDFGKDIVAAKNLNMRTIWSRELVKSSSQNNAEIQSTVSKQEKVAIGSNNDDDDTKNVPFGNGITKSVMEVGSDDYLLDSIQREFCDAVTDQFVDISSIVHQWNQEAMQTTTVTTTMMASSITTSTATSSITIGYDNVTQLEETTIEDEERIILTEEIEYSITNIANPVLLDDEKMNAMMKETTTTTSMAGQPEKDFKFCIHCGEKLPTLAKFCSSCGKIQTN